MADSGSDSDSGPAIVVRPMHPRAVRLHPAFDSCILGELTLDARWVYSTDRMEAVLRAQGWEPEEARVRVARMTTVVSPGWPDFLD